MHSSIEEKLNRSRLIVEYKGIEIEHFNPIIKVSLLLNLELEQDGIVLDGEENFYTEFGKWFFEKVRECQSKLANKSEGGVE